MNRTEIIIIIILAVIILLLIFLPIKAKDKPKEPPFVPETIPDIKPPSSFPPEYNVVPTTSQKLEVINPQGIYAYDFGPEGCMTVQKDFIPVGTIMPILEVKANFSKCLEPVSITIVRTLKGWFSLNPIVVKII